MIKISIKSHNDLHLGNIMRNAEGDFDPNRLVFVDFDLAAYGARAFDINYHTSYWLPDCGEFKVFVIIRISDIKKNFRHKNGIFENLSR